MAAHVSLRADKPTLILEHIHDLLTNITCTPESIMIQALPSAYPEIHRMLGQETEFYIMTSHETCNEQGSRLPHL